MPSAFAPDREPVHIRSIEKHLHIADIIQTGVPNYVQARIPIASGLNSEAWEPALVDYPDKFFKTIYQVRSPLSNVSPDTLHTIDIHNCTSTTSLLEHIQEYLDKERSLGAMLGPVESANSLPTFPQFPIIVWTKGGK